MMTPQEAERVRATASFRIIGDTLDPADWTAYFGVAPSITGRKGDLRQTRYTYRTGIWSTQSTVVSDVLDDHVAHLVQTLQLPRADLAERLRHAGANADIFCFLDNAENDLIKTVSQPMIELLAAQGVTVEVDLYPQEVLFCDKHGCQKGII